MAAGRRILLKKLLTTSHLNVQERRLLVDAPSFSELLEIAEEHFERANFLPDIIKSWDSNTVNYEGYSLEKTDNNYVLHFQQAGPALNLYANEKSDFKNLKEALHAFINKEFRFNIDGVPIMDK